MKIPDAQSLADFCEATGASAEYLVHGTGAPLRGLTKGRSELAEELFKYVTADYVRRRGRRHPNVDGLARVLHAYATKLSVVDFDHAAGMPRLTAEFEPTEPDPRALITDDPQLFLSDVCAWVYEKAEAVEREADAREQEQLREVLGRAQADLDCLTAEGEFTEEQRYAITQRLLRAALYPLDQYLLDQKAKIHATTWSRSLHNDAHSRRQFTAWLDETVPDIVEAELKAESAAPALLKRSRRPAEMESELSDSERDD